MKYVLTLEEHYLQNTKFTWRANWPQSNSQRNGSSYENAIRYQTYNHINI